MTEKQLDDDHQLPRSMASAWRSDAVRRAQHPEEFWHRQHVQIRARVQSSSAPRRRGLRMVLATAALLFLAVLIMAPARPRPAQPATPHARVDADQQLLLAVEHALSVGTPEALEPLTLLVESSSNHDVETMNHKEHRHEN